MGKAVVFTKLGPGPETIENYETGLLCENNNVNQFSEALLKLVEDDTLRESFSQKGWQHVKEKFHYTRLVNDMQKLYAELLL